MDKGPGQKAREPRYPYRGRLRLMIPFPPWRLLLTLEGQNLSTSGVSARLPEGDAAGGADDLLQLADTYELQLEHDAEHLPAPQVRATLVRRVRTTAGLELALRFETTDVNLLGLVHELAQGR